MATGNPAMSEAVYRRAGWRFARQAMTIQGAVLKTAILVVILLATAAYTWSQVVEGATTVAYGLLIAGVDRRLHHGPRDHLHPQGVPRSRHPIYAALEGLVLGAISAVFEAMYPGIVIQAVGLSVGVLAVMLFVYGTGIIRATEKFKIGVVAATGAVCLVYLVSIVAVLVRHPPALHPRVGAGGHRLLPGRRRHRGLEPDSGLRLHRAGGQAAGTQVHGVVRRVQPAGHAGLDVPGNPAAAGQVAGRWPGLTHRIGRVRGGLRQRRWPCLEWSPV